MYKNELEIDVFRCIRALIKRWKFIVLITALFFIAGFALTLNVGVDKYTASATVYASADGSYSDATNAVTAMNAYLNVANSYKVSQRAALLMGRSDVTPEDIMSAVRVNSSGKTSSSSVTNFMNSSATIITFSATTVDPELSKDMADAMAQSYTIEMTSILNNDSVKTLDNAYTAYKSVDASMNAWKNRIKYTGIGLALACLIVLASEIFDTKVRTVREATIREQIPVIGIIPDYKD